MDPIAGDVNEDGKVSAVDARWALQCAAKKRNLTPEQLLAADMNGDGRITAVDARQILKKAAGKDTDTPVAADKAAVVKALNEATANAAEAGYDWSRKCYFTQPLQVLTSSGKNAADTLNGIIQKVDENATVDSVVGNFLGVTGTQSDPPKTATKAKGTEVPEAMGSDKFLLQAMELTEGDIKNLKVVGNEYTIQLQNCANPQKGSDNNALNHATKDFITYDEVETSVKEALGSLSSLLSVESADVNYTSIIITAEITDGKLTSLAYTYVMDVKALELRAAVVPMTGKGKCKVDASYTNFVY